MNDARKAEATMKPALVEFRGHTFTIAREQDDWTIDLLESLEDGKAVGIVRGALGPSQWPHVKAMELKVRDLNELSSLIAQALGLGSAGE